MEIATERVSIPLAEGGKMGGYLARPKSGGPYREHPEAAAEPPMEPAAVHQD